MYGTHVGAAVNPGNALYLFPLHWGARCYALVHAISFWTYLGHVPAKKTSRHTVRVMVAATTKSA
jgi:hypothetical protein